MESFIKNLRLTALLIASGVLFMCSYLVMKNPELSNELSNNALVAIFLLIAANIIKDIK